MSEPNVTFMRWFGIHSASLHPRAVLFAAPAFLPALEPADRLFRVWIRFCKRGHGVIQFCKTIEWRRCILS